MGQESEVAHFTVTVPKRQDWDWKPSLFTPKGFPLKAVFFRCWCFLAYFTG